MNLAVLAPGVTAGIAAVGAWLVARRRGSGRVVTTEAERLWAASEQIRTDLMAQLAARDTRITQLESRIIELERQLHG